ncbi:MAG: hypothetical protein IJC75_04930 [Oscillospiraceae bacterium]|nr:hypothetical protein [Ruminococcus sp.]MBQ4346463.1 hypothetical protein [Oscillospiraceae bacterium]
MRWCIAAISALFGLGITAANWVGVYRYYKHGHTSSRIPLLGGAFLAVGFALMPHNPVSHLWWLAFLIDCGSLPLLICTVWFFIRRK